MLSMARVRPIHIVIVVLGSLLVLGIGLTLYFSFVMCDCQGHIKATANSIYATNTAVEKLIEGTQTATMATAQLQH